MSDASSGSSAAPAASLGPTSSSISASNSRARVPTFSVEGARLLAPPANRGERRGDGAGSSPARAELGERIGDAGEVAAMSTAPLAVFSVAARPASSFSFLALP